MIVSRDHIRDATLNLPLSKVFAGRSVVVGNFKLDAAHLTAVRWLNVYMTTDPGTAVISTFSPVYVGLYHEFLDVMRPAGKPALYVPVTAKNTVYQSNPYFPMNLSPGNYSLMVVNNSDTVADVAVTCSVRLHLTGL